MAPNIKHFMAIVIFVAFISFFTVFRSNEQISPRSKTLIQEHGSAGGMVVENRLGQLVHGHFSPSVVVHELNASTVYTENGQVKIMNLFLMGTSTNPPFIATVALPTQDAASREVWQRGDMELPTRRLFEYLLIDRCKQHPSPLVLDAGANLGYFSTYSAVMGCRVVAVEPQPRLRPIIEASVAVNGVGDRFTLHSNIISTNPTDRLKIVYDQGICWGCSTVQPARPDEVSRDNQFIVDAVRLDSVVKEDILLMKVDVEVLALESAENIFKHFTVQNIIIEWSGKRWSHSVERATKLLESLYDYGFTIRHYDLRFILPLDMVTNPRKMFPLIGPTWEIPRDQIGNMNKFLKESNTYGEANLWLSKER